MQLKKEDMKWRNNLLLLLLRRFPQDYKLIIMMMIMRVKMTMTMKKTLCDCIARLITIVDSYHSNKIRLTNQLIRNSLLEMPRLVL